MAEQFNHKYELEFGQPISFYGADRDTNFKSIPYPVNYTTSQSKAASYFDNANGDKGVRLTSHNMSFSIRKGKDASKDTKITIYNISDNVRSFLEANNGKKPVILLKAGYMTDQELPILFNGEVIMVDDQFNGTTRITELTCATGTTSIQEAYSVKTFKKGTPVSTIVREVLKDLKLPEGTFYLPDTASLGIEKPVVYSGPTIEFLRKYGKDNGFKVWVEDGTVSVFSDDPTSRIQRATAFKISSSLNMIGSPAAQTADASQTQNTAGVRQNVKVSTTLNGAYSIGAKVELESKYLSGVYEIESIEHTGTYEGSDWKSDLELKPLDGWEKEVVYQNFN